MKKIFYILASAIVALGAVACENEALDNVNPDNNVKGEGLTITVNIDEATKVAFEGLTPSWEANDKLTIGTYEFTYTDNNTFTCAKEGVYSLCDGQKKEITAGTFDSSNGINGSAWWAQSVIEREGTVVELQLVTALLKVTAAADNTVLKSTMFSYEEDVALTKGVETYVPIWRGDNTTVTYYVDGVECKSLTKNFEAGKVYNLGTLAAPAAIWMLGDWDGWANPLRMYVEGDYYVARNVKIAADQGFKFNDGTKYLGGASTANAWNNFNGSNITLAAGTYDIYISKTNGAWCAVTAGNAAPALNKRYLYLNPSNNWKEASAKFVAWCYGGTASDANKQFTWAMYENSKDYYYLDITGYKQFYIKRLDPNAAIGDSAWNEVGPVTIGNNSLITISGWDSYSAGSLVP